MQSGHYHSWNNLQSNTFLSLCSRWILSAKGRRRPWPASLYSLSIEKFPEGPLRFQKRFQKGYLRFRGPIYVWGSIRLGILRKEKIRSSGYGCGCERCLRWTDLSSLYKTSLMPKPLFPSLSFGCRCMVCLYSSCSSLPKARIRVE